MQRRTIWIIASTVAAAIVIAGSIVWYRAQAYDDLLADCGKALAATHESEEEGRPEACNGVEKDDYRGLVLKSIFDNMSPEGKETVDWLTRNGG